MDRSRAVQERDFALLLLLPAVLCTGACIFVPIVRSVVVSFFAGSLETAAQGARWTGLANYRAVFKGGAILRSLSVTVTFAAVVTAVMFALGLALAEVFSHVVPNPAACLVSEAEGGTRLYTVNFADAVDEYYLRDGEGNWAERNGIDDEENAEGVRKAREEILSVFDSDERWSSYAAFLRLIHAKTLAENSDLQKFVNS